MSSLYSFYKNTPGLQVKRDMDFSNVTIQCDPRLVVPDNATTQTSGLFKKDTAGKIAVEHDICDLDVSNLTVNGIAEVCDIACPVDFNLTAGNNINETAGGQIVLTAEATANTQTLSGVKVLGNNDPSSTQTGTQSGASLNVLPNQVGAKGLAVVTKHDTAGVHAIAADLTGTTILRADTAGSTTGATGHLMFAPAQDEDPTVVVQAGALNVATFVGFASDSCGQIRVRSTGVPVNVIVDLRFAKLFPTSVLNVFLTPASRPAAAVFGSATGCWVSATGINGFNVSFTSPDGSVTAQDVDFNYFVVDVVAPATQIG
jgi:hypothetical protein